MKAAGIICEFNPFHNGHKYLFDMVRQDINPDALVCVMSGNFVQRGEPAFWDKYTRAKMAVNCGADIVIELPVVYAVNNAKEFASGGIEILNSLGCISHYCFGSESGDAKELLKIAEATLNEDKEFAAIIKAFLGEGISYPKAYEMALNKRFSIETAVDLSASNNILALEYIKSAQRLKSKMTPYTIKRTGSEHDADDASSDNCSSSYIRKMLLEKVDLSRMQYAYPSENDGLMYNHFDCSVALDKYFSLVRYSVLRKSAYDLADILEISEGLENKIKKSLLNASDLEELIQLIKSKRYTYARISRILAQIVLGITKEEYSECKKYPYARVLAFNEKGRELLKELKVSSSVPILTNLNKQDEIAGNLPGLKFDYFASDIYSIISGKTIYENSDKVCNSLPLNI